jgi:hypothetical protein
MTASNISWISKRMAVAALKDPAAVAAVVAFAVLSAYGQSETPGESMPSSGVDLAYGSKLAYGTKVSFGTGGNSEPFRVSGWSGTEEESTWTEGTSAVLTMRVSPTTDPVVLKMKLAGLTKDPDLPFQPVEVYINDQKVADWHVADTAEFSAAIPQTMTNSRGVLGSYRVLRITLKIPKAVSPKALGLSDDPRVLGVSCIDLQLVKTG